ncbi:porin [Hydrogenovibrio kuenenii]|uniref:porin n=1 Tax=Hydrogenovibrio kuenenii TaxID=63658 RepID=UPI0004673A8B|nr:porin [Hydrogenovibrio kuenenii]
MKKHLLKKVLPIAILAATASTSVQAANWLMLQGTEPANQAPRAKVWGFLQLDYQSTDDTKLKAGPYKGKSAAFNQVAPQLSSPSSFNVKRARIGVRGNNFPLDPKVNYFLLTEFGNNGITTGGKASQGQLTDASVTLNHIPGARIRVGLFKTPGSEKAMQGIGVYNYVNFTSVVDRLLLERSFTNSTGDTTRSQPVSAFRDTGVEVFDSFNLKGWDTSYAVMMGNGNGLAMTDNNKSKDTYLYLSTEKVFGASKGPRRHGLKFYAWSQNGKRTINISGVATDKDRSRSGLGTTYFDGKYRMTAEYITAKGMIYGGTKGAGLPADGASFSVQTDEEANGYYVDLGYRVKPNIELNARYDFLDSGTKVAANERKFTNTTLGAQYFFNKKTTLMADYEIRKIEAPAGNATVKSILDSLDNRLALQLRVVF